MSLSKLKFDIALTHFPKFGPVRQRRLLKHFENAEAAFYAKAGDLEKAGIEKDLAMEFTAARSEIEPEAIIEKLDKEGINVLSIESEGYPKRLREIYDAPRLLYYKGELGEKGRDEFSLAVVGTRKFTHYGQQAAETITRGLARSGITVVSGLALGIDAIAHNACLETGGRTLAVLGSGLDRASIYPAANRYLAEAIVARKGALISEFPVDTPPLRHHFPQRNRIISGLSLGVVVIEAGEKSGALITARHALDQNREVFAVPGPIFSDVSIGPNRLIKAGAQAVTGAEDILEALDLEQATAYIEHQRAMPDTPEEELIAAELSQEPLHIDEIVRLTKLAAALVSSTLVVMEMKGMVRNLGGMQYVLAR